MTWGTFIVLAVLAAVIWFALRSMAKDRKAGRHVCGGNCSACMGGCAHQNHMSDEEILELAKRAQQGK